MELHISPKDIEQRADAMAAAEKAAEVKPEATPEVKPEVKVEAPVELKPEVKPEVKTEVKPEPEVKPEVKPEKKQPNDPAELRKWSTKLSQENAALRDEMKGIKAAIEKMSKKPVDYSALAKDPAALQKQIELERQEAVAELQEQLQETNNRAVQNETVVAKMELERDTENHPRWNKLFPLIQNLAGNQDGRINFNRPPREVLHDLYDLANQLSPVDAPTVVVPTPAPVVPAAPTKTAEQIEAEIQAKITEAEERGFKKAQEALRNEQSGGGIGSAGTGGRRDSKVSKEALMKMDRNELKKMIQQ